MGRKLHFRMGSFYRTDDRTGFPQRAERTKKEWTGSIVDERLWEPRQPQDLVRGVPDFQSVPDARPLAPNSFVGPLYTTLLSAVSAHASKIELSSNAQAAISVGQRIGVMLDNGVMFSSIVSRVGAATFADFVIGVDALDNDPNSVVLTASLPYHAASGNDVVIYAQNPVLPA